MLILEFDRWVGIRALPDSSTDVPRAVPRSVMGPGPWLSLTMTLLCKYHMMEFPGATAEPDNLEDKVREKL